jgi:DNA polymerase
MPTPQVLIWDIETYSQIDLKKVGAWRYSTHTSTGVWCVYYCAGDDEIKGWRPGEPVPAEILEAAGNPDWVFAAFNASFERFILQHILVLRYDWPLVPIERHRCLQASASTYALPANLKGVGEALKLDLQKDAAGRRLMLKLAKIEDPSSVDPALLQQLYRYCERDVAAERELYRKLGFLPDPEQAIWVRDQTINDRGIHIDRPLVTIAKKIVEQARANLDKELCQITDGAVESVHQCSRLAQWLADNGCSVEAVDRTALRKVLTRNGLSEKVQRAINIRLAGAHASASKLDAMLNWINPDNRVRGCFKYHGASTGRWTSHGIQLQNLKKPNGADMDALIALVSTSDIEQIRAAKLEPVSVIGDLTRAMICAAPGHRFIIGDFSGIESRVLAWLAGQTDKLELWANFDRTGELEDDVYYRLGLKFGFTPERGYAPEQTRALGKICDLAFGYMGGEGAWRNLSPDDDLTAEQIKAHQQAWRAAHPYVVALWKALDNAAIRAVQSPCKVIKLPRQAWQWGGFVSDGMFLRMSLPSGRSLAYPFPELKTGKFNKPVVSFKDVTLGKWGDCRHGQGAYGGTWIENAVQAVARDILAEAMLRVEAAGYQICAHVHDEIVIEAPQGFGNTQEFEKLITTPPAWATDLPLAAKVRNGQRFCKLEPVAPDPIEELISEPTVGPPPFDLDPKHVHAREEPEPEQAAADNVNDAPTGEPPHYEHHRHNSDGHVHGDTGPKRGNTIGQWFYQNPPDRPNYLRVDKHITSNGKRNFYQHHWNGTQWVLGVKDTYAERKIPYRLAELRAALKADPDMEVQLPEGEKDADTLARLGYVATTNPGGALSWTDDLTAWLRILGVRRAVIHEDSDEKGRQRTAKLIAALEGFIKLRVVRYPDVPQGEDVTWWVTEGGHTKEELAERIRAAPAAVPDIIILTKAEFLRGFVPPDYLVDGVLQRRFIYSFTGQTGHGKTAVALRIVQLVDCGGLLAGHLIRRGKVAYLVGENPDDVRMRVIGDDAILGQSGYGGIKFIPGVFDTDRLLQQVESLGELDLVIIDTSAAYFLGEDENANPEMGTHARKLRQLLMLPGGPCVLVLCHPIKHATDVSMLLPRGGGAFLAEMDGNLTGWKEDKLVTLHHSDKFRGAGFEPITFRLDPVRTPKLVDSRGRELPTVRAVALTDNEEAQEVASSQKDENELVLARHNGAGSMSIAELAEAMGWILGNGDPHKSKVARVLKRLEKAKLMKNERGKWDLTEKGEKLARKLKNASDDE